MDYNSFEEDGPLEKIKTALAEMGEKAKPYTPHIIGAIVLLAVIAYYLLFAPKTVLVNVSVTELDGGALDGVEVYFRDLNGNQIGITSISQDGRASFEGIPAEKDLELVADAGAAFRRAVKQVKVSGNTELDVQVERKNGIRITSNNLPTSVSSGCKDKFFVEVTNWGEDYYDAQLIGEGEGDFDQYFTITGARTLEVNESTNFTVSMELPKVEDNGEGASTAVSGAFRVKGTSQKAGLNTVIGPEIQIQTSESAIDFTIDNQDGKRITVTNTGKQPLSNLEFGMLLQDSLKSKCGSDGTKCFKIEVLEDGGKIKTLSPGSKVDAILTLNSQGLDDKYLASLEITGTCLNSPGITIPVTLDFKPVETG